ncbi:MAG: MarR family transcriptional regulator [Eubacteriales bacterium]|nr:MarR family transcriptional regulator [Eubacteriales bacterium]
MINKFEAFTNNIAIINKGIGQLKNEVMKQFNLRGNQGMILFYLRQYSEGRTLSQLSEVMGIDKAAVSRGLSELHKNKYIVFSDYTGSKRYNTPAILTETGKSVIDKVNEIICDIVDRVSLSNMSEDERAIMYRSMKSIAENIETFQKDKSRLQEVFSKTEISSC